MSTHLLTWRWLILGLVCFSSAAWAQQAKLENVRLSTFDNRTRVVFDLSASVKPDIFMLSNPARLVVDMPDTRKAGEHAAAWAGKGVVKKLRSGVRKHYNLRVVLDLASAKIQPRSFLLTADDKPGSRLVVDIYNDGADVAPVPDDATGLQQLADNATSKTNKHKPARSQTAKKKAKSKTKTQTAQKTAPKSKPKAKPVAYQPPSPTDKIVVAIDAGHGGHDPGAIGPHGVMEKNVVLGMARKLAAMIDEQPNMHAVLTRKRDVYVGLRQRIVLARDADADLFVSIHANSSTDPGPHGASVFALSLDGATSEHAHLLAKRENAALQIGGVDLEGKNAKVASFMLDLAQSATIEASLDVGRRVLHNLGRFTPLLRTKVEQAAFVVLKSPDTPSILVETGFISNASEAHELQTDAYQTRVAQALLHGIKGYFDSYHPGTIIATSQVHKVSSGETLSGIAATYHVSLSRLRDYNDIKGSLIHVGQTLNIPPPEMQQVASR